MQGMRFEKVLEKSNGSVVCIENGAIITITGTGADKRYTPSVPSGSQPLPETTFKQFYQAKHFEDAAPQTPTQPATKGTK